MSDIAKCPICGRDAVLDGTARIYCRCTNCMFRCDSDDLPRITAAMELAIALAWREEIDPQVDWLGDRIYNVMYWAEVCRTWTKAKADIEIAKKRVLEVFK